MRRGEREGDEVKRDGRDKTLGAPLQKTLGASFRGLTVPLPLKGLFFRFCLPQKTFLMVEHLLDNASTQRYSGSCSIDRPS